jgi:hypothetical protein
MKQTKRPLVYLSCALTHAPTDFLDDINYLRTRIEQYATVLEFLGLNHPSVDEAFQWDTNCARRCDVVVANVTYPSIGLGLEFGVALENKKPFITIADDQKAVERILPWGYWDPLHFKLRYKTREEAADFVIDKLHQLFPESYAENTKP